MTGKGNPGETAADCAARESLEETGLRGELVDLAYVHRYRGRKGMFEEHAFLLRVAEDSAPRWASAQDARSAVRWNAHATALDLALKAF